MSGSSSTWYATSARLRSSRSSRTRASTLEVAKQLLGSVDDRVRPLRLEPRAVVDPPPGDGDRVHAGGLCRTHIERRVAHVGGILRARVEALEREQQRLRLRLV